MAPALSPLDTPDMTLAECIARWEARRAEYARVDAHVAATKLLDELLTELKRVAGAQHHALFNLTQAGAASGYTADHIGRLVRAGLVTNYGRPGAPRVRLSELPRRTRRAAPLGGHSAPAYDAATDARSLRSPHRHGD